VNRLGIGLVGAVLAAASTVGAAEPPANPENFMFQEPPQPLPGIHFKDGAARSHSLAEFRGKAVLLYVWATWCVTCRKEMPALDRVQASLGGADFEVVALSVDREGPEAVRKFYAEFGIRHLPLRIDPSTRTLGDLGGTGVPTSLFIDRQGLELGRLFGRAEWDAPEQLGFLRWFISRQVGTAAPPRKKGNGS